MQNRLLPWLRAIYSGCVFAAFLPTVHAENTGEVFERLAPEISYLCYGDVLWLRTPEHYFKDDPDLKTSWEHYEEAMTVKADLAELEALTRHADPKVRTLALIRLYHIEDPAAFRIIHTLVFDMAVSFSARSFQGQLLDGTLGMRSETKTVAQVARMMLEQTKFPVDWLENPASDFAVEEWSGWYKYLYHRATGRISSIPKERAPQIAEVRRKIDALLPIPRAWILIEIGLIDVDNNESCQPSRVLKLLATNEELIAAAKQLGPDALLGFLKDGTREGLRHQSKDEIWRDQKFILAHARQLFRKQDAEALRSMKFLVAAADADPEMASRLIREELAHMSESQSTYDMGKVLAALVDLRGDQECDFVVETFYSLPWQTAQSNPSGGFADELKRRKPAEWKKTILGIISHAGFEQLDEGAVNGFARMIGVLEGVEIVDWNGDSESFSATALRTTLRKHFGLPLVNYRPLVEKIEFVKLPVFSVKLPAKAEFIELSPDGLVLAAIPYQGALRVVSAMDGKLIGSLATEGEVRAVHFGSEKNQLMTLNRDRLLQTWDMTTAKEISRNQSDYLSIYYHVIFSRSGEFMIAGVDPGYAVIDLKTGKRRWEIEMRRRGDGMFRLSPDEKRLAINDGFGKTIQFFDMATGNPLVTLKGHADVPMYGAFSPDGSLFVSSADDNKVMFWDGKTGALKREFVLSSGLRPQMVFTADSRSIFGINNEGRIVLVDVESGVANRAFDQAKELSERSGYTKFLRVSADGKKLYALVQTAGDRRRMVEGDTYLECWNLP